MENVKVKEEHTKDDVRRIIIGKALELFTSRAKPNFKSDVNTVSPIIFLLYMKFKFNAKK